MGKCQKILFFIYALISFPLFTVSQGKIDIQGEIVLAADGSMIVVEKFKVISKRKGFKRYIPSRHLGKDVGSILTFPYGYSWRTFYQLPIKMIKCERNGKKLKYSQLPRPLGVAIYAGTKDEFAEQHQEWNYKWVYRTYCIFGKYNNSIEWRLKPDREGMATLQIKLPTELSVEKVKWSAPKNCTVTTDAAGIVRFHIARLKPHKRFYLVITWPKEVVGPSVIVKWKAYLRADPVIICLIAGFLMILFYYLTIKILLRKFLYKQQKIVSCTKPPDNFSAAKISHFDFFHFRYYLSATLISLAIKKYLLLKKTVEEGSVFHTESFLHFITFFILLIALSIAPLILLAPTNYIGMKFLPISGILLGVIMGVLMQQKFLGKDFISKNSFLLWTIVSVGCLYGSCVVLIVGILLTIYHIITLSFMTISGLATVWIPYFCFIAIWMIHGFFSGTNLNFYTDKGKEIKRQVDGFKKFLSNTQNNIHLLHKAKNKVKTFEAYLPYAIGLNKEKEWILALAKHRYSAILNVFKGVYQKK